MSVAIKTENGIETVANVGGGSTTLSYSTEGLTFGTGCTYQAGGYYVVGNRVHIDIRIQVTESKNGYSINGFPSAQLAVPITADYTAKSGASSVYTHGFVNTSGTLQIRCMSNPSVNDALIASADYLIQ